MGYDLMFPMTALRLGGCVGSELNTEFGMRDADGKSKVQGRESRARGDADFGMRNESRVAKKRPRFFKTNIDNRRTRDCAVL